jgi:hypothetical protein
MFKLFFNGLYLGSATPAAGAAATAAVAPAPAPAPATQ